MIPPGVAETNPESPRVIAARDRIVTPSTSLAGSMASKTARSSTWGGSGCWTRMPSTVGSADRPATAPTTSSVLAAGGSLTTTGPTWADAARRCFIETYVTEAGSSPTSTAASLGARPTPVTALPEG